MWGTAALLAVCLLLGGCATPPDTALPDTLTGSDAGKGLDYAFGHEDALWDAYDVLLGGPREWEQRGVILADRVALTMSRPGDLAEAALRGARRAAHDRHRASAAYAAHDRVITCSTVDTCLNVRPFGAWLVGQYLIPNLRR